MLVVQLVSPLLIYQQIPFEFQLPPAKSSLTLIMTFLFRDFKDEHLYPIFTVLQLGAER